MAVTPHGVLPRGSHEISPTIGGGTKVDDFTKGCFEGKITETNRRRNRGGSGGLRPPYNMCENGAQTLNIRKNEPSEHMF